MATPPVRTEIVDTYPLPSNATARTGLGKLYDYVTALLGATGTAADARLALGVSAIVGASGTPCYRNRLTNGNFRINQRTVSGTVTLAAGVYGHDMWKAGASGCTYTFATSGLDTTITITAGSLMQVIEDKNVEGGVYALSHAGTAQARIAINGAATSGSYATASTASPLLSSSATAGQAMIVEFSTGTVTKTQLEVGTVATSFERETYAETYDKCLRYFWRVYAPSTAAIYSNVNASVLLSFPLPKAMRTTPTINHNLTDGNYVATGPTGSQWSLQAAGLAYAVKTGTCSISASVAGGQNTGFAMIAIYSATFSQGPNYFGSGSTAYIEAVAVL